MLLVMNFLNIHILAYIFLIMDVLLHHLTADIIMKLFQIYFTLTLLITKYKLLIIHSRLNNYRFISLSWQYIILKHFLLILITQHDCTFGDLLI